MVLNQSVAISYILCIGLNWSSFNSSVLHFSKRIQTFPLLLYIFTYAHTKHSTPCHLAWILEQPIKFLFTNCRRMAAFVYGQETFTRPIKWFLRREHWVNIFVETFAISLLLVISLSQLRFYSWEKQVAASHFSNSYTFLTLLEHTLDILYLWIYRRSFSSLLFADKITRFSSLFFGICAIPWTSLSRWNYLHR